MFPWYQCGAKFDVDMARFDRTPPIPGIMDMSLMGYCVPQLWSRRLPGEDDWGETRKLPYDDWMLPKAAATYVPEYWDSAESVKAMADSVSVEVVDEPMVEFLQLEYGIDFAPPPVFELDFEYASDFAPPPYFELKEDFVSPPVIDHDAGGYFYYDSGCGF
jgi:hypothetical protein